jgi:hypothetical protein
MNPDFAASLTIFIYIYNQSGFIRVNPSPISRHSKGYIVALLSIYEPDEEQWINYEQRK